MDVTKTLRRWDDWGKLHGVEGPGLDAYRQVVLDHLLSSRIQARSTPGKLHSSIPQMRECSRRRPPSMGKSTRSKTPSNLCRQQRDQSEGPHPRFHQQPARLQKTGVKFSGDWSAWSGCVSTTIATGWMPCLALPPW